MAGRHKQLQEAAQVPQHRWCCRHSAHPLLCVLGGCLMALVSLPAARSLPSGDQHCSFLVVLLSAPSLLLTLGLAPVCNELQAPVAQLLCVLCLWPSVLHWHQASNAGAQTHQKVHWRLRFGFILHYWHLLKIHSFFAKSIEVCWPAPKQYQVLLCVDVLVPVRALQALSSQSC